MIKLLNENEELKITRLTQKSKAISIIAIFLFSFLFLFIYIVKMF